MVRVFYRHARSVTPLAPRAEVHSYILVAEHLERDEAVCRTVTSLAVCYHFGILWNVAIHLHQLVTALENILIYVIVPVNVDGIRDVTCTRCPDRRAFVLVF